MENLEFKGTRGEWKAVKMTYKIGLATHEIQFNNDGECVTDGVYGEANAKLIAEAPHLLEACQVAYKLCDKITMPKETEIEALKFYLQKAIEKALK